MTLKPKLEYQPTPRQKINAGSTPAKKRWRFSLRFWQQIDNFGLDRSKASWFVTVLEKLAEYSKEELDVFLSDTKRREAFRFHEINWNQPGIPIRRKDLDWIDEHYLSNEEEVRFYQMQVSSSLGRVVGFFDEHDVFNIVLLDNWHNAQPTKATGYRVDKCYPLPNDFGALIATIQKIADVNWCKEQDCKMRKALKGIYDVAVDPGVIIMNLPEQIYSKVVDLIEKEGVGRLEDFFEYGIMFFEERQQDEEDVVS